MPIPLETLQKIIEKALPGAEVLIQDLVGDGDHLQATVISELFEGKSLLQRHQMVYGPLNEILRGELHALALKTYTPKQIEGMK